MLVAMGWAAATKSAPTQLLARVSFLGWALSSD